MATRACSSVLEYDEAHSCRWNSRCRSQLSVSENVTATATRASMTKPDRQGPTTDRDRLPNSPRMRAAVANLARAGLEASVAALAERRPSGTGAC